MKAIVTGSFDPITLGHIEIIKKAKELFDEIYVVALINKDKSYMFSLEEKKEIMSASLSNIENVVVDAYDRMTADYMHSKGINRIVRGIRGPEDEKYETMLADAMKSFDPDFETVFIQSSDEFKHISSTYAREAIINGKSLDKIISQKAIEKVKEIFNSKKKLSTD